MPLTAVFACVGLFLADPHKVLKHVELGEWSLRTYYRQSHQKSYQTQTQDPLRECNQSTLEGPMLKGPRTSSSMLSGARSPNSLDIFIFALVFCKGNLMGQMEQALGAWSLSSQEISPPATTPLPFLDKFSAACSPALWHLTPLPTSVSSMNNYLCHLPPAHAGTWQRVGAAEEGWLPTEHPDEVYGGDCPRPHWGGHTWDTRVQWPACPSTEGAIPCQSGHLQL